MVFDTTVYDTMVFDTRVFDLIKLSSQSSPPPYINFTLVRYDVLREDIFPYSHSFQNRRPALSNSLFSTFLTTRRR